jgi:hypothetical protein
VFISVFNSGRRTGRLAQRAAVPLLHGRTLRQVYDILPGAAAQRTAARRWPLIYRLLIACLLPVYCLFIA